MMRRQAGCDGIIMTDWKRKISHLERLLPCNTVQETAETARSFRDRVPLVVKMPETAYCAAHISRRAK